MSTAANDAQTQPLNDHDHDGKLNVQHATDPHPDRPQPPGPPAQNLKRATLVALLAVLFSLAWAVFLKPLTINKPNVNVIHASRYSKEFKYQPAASPVITERLKDGRVRLRGAHPAY